MDRHTEITLIQEIIGLAEQKSAYLDDEIATHPFHAIPVLNNLNENRQ